MKFIDLTRLFKIFIVSMLFFVPKLAFAELEKDFSCKFQLGSNSRLALLGEMDRRYSEVLGFTAKFRQESKMLAGTGAVSNHGEVSFAKPGKMHWRYQKPPQLFVSDGRTVWYFQPEEDQVDEKSEQAGEVTLIDFKSAFSSETPGSFLLGLGSLSKDFKMVSGCETRAGYAVELKPLVEDENLERFYLLVRKQDNLAIGARIVDFSENETIIRFDDLKVNPKIKPNEFSFKIPRGVFIDDRRVKTLPPALREDS